MADNEREGEKTSSRGTDWEVVSLTASAYAAAPDPDGIGLVDETKDKDFGGTDLESARAMFMSGHFVFPPSEHENLPLEPDSGEILTASHVLDTNPDNTQEENQSVKELSEAAELREIPFFDKGKRLYVSSMEFKEGKTTLQGLNLVEEEQANDGGPVSRSFNNEIGGLTPSDESSDGAEGDASSIQNLGSPSDCSKSSMPVKESKNNGSGIPCEAWWKRRAASLYAHAKGANTFWSICVTAALMGLVILGQRWQQERWQIQQLKFQYSMSDEKMRWFLGPISRLKDVFVGGHQRSPVIHIGSSADH